LNFDLDLSIVNNHIRHRHPSHISWKTDLYFS